MPTMTVGQLRALLEQLPDDYQVTTEGCDCSGDVLSVLVEAEIRNVHLRRSSKDSGDPHQFKAGDWVLRLGVEGMEPYL